MKHQYKMGLSVVALLLLSYKPINNASEPLFQKQETQSSSRFQQPDATKTKDSQVVVEDESALEEYLKDTALYPFEVDGFVYADMMVLQYNDTTRPYLQVEQPTLTDVRTILYNSGVVPLMLYYGRDLQRQSLDHRSAKILGELVLYDLIAKRATAIKSASKD